MTLFFRPPPQHIDDLLGVDWLSAMRSALIQFHKKNEWLLAYPQCSEEDLGLWITAWKLQGPSIKRNRTAFLGLVNAGRNAAGAWTSSTCAAKWVQESAKTYFDEVSLYKSNQTTAFSKAALMFRPDLAVVDDSLVRKAIKPICRILAIKGKGLERVSKTTQAFDVIYKKKEKTIIDLIKIYEENSTAEKMKTFSIKNNMPKSLFANYVDLGTAFKRRTLDIALMMVGDNQS
jgi:hypothetical protein